MEVNMAQLFGNELRKKDILKRIGRLSQIGGIRLFEFTDGPARGTRAADIKTGSGLDFTVLLDRGMDIGSAFFSGCPLCWTSPVGVVSAKFFHPKDKMWLNTFGGGLLTTCGLLNVGNANIDQGDELSLHGAITSVPAEEVKVGHCWNSDDMEISIEGSMREASVFGSNLVLNRLIWTRLGEKKIFIEDTLVNEGHEKSPLMILYHINIGWPILDEETLLILPSRKMKPRDEEAEKGAADFDQFHAPEKNYMEKVYFHSMAPDSMGNINIGIVNPGLHSGCSGLYIKYPYQELPHFTQWKMLGQGAYVLGIEPGNCTVLGRAREREEGRLQFIDPGEKKTFHLEIGVLTTPEELDQISEQVNGVK